VTDAERRIPVQYPSAWWAQMYGAKHLPPHKVNMSASCLHLAQSSPPARHHLHVLRHHNQSGGLWGGFLRTFQLHQRHLLCVLLLIIIFVTSRDDPFKPH
jgi:hypothetical protein